MTTAAPAVAPPTNQATPNSLASNSSTEASPAIQELHQQQQKNSMSALEMQRQLLAQKLAQQPVGFVSPTDEMMTPCSKKLQDHKKKAFTKAKPTSLASRFGKAMAESKERQAASSSSSLFGEPASQ
ncbi:hypothetical protein BDD12DRAFT_882737 [Trichophaea hybrida]|nr:hypothetical protein BDD12DRAFT_882737 [Trichophaea hybrida]